MSFGKGLSQGLQLGISAINRKNEDKAAEERFNERLAEQRAYGVMEDTKKEARALGATAEELGTYSGAENQYALDRRMDELRAEYKAGRAAQLSGEGSGQPTDSLLGETGIATSAGYMRGVESGKSQQQEQEFLNRMNLSASAKQREAIRGETDAEASQKIIDSLSRKYPGEEFDANAPLSVLQEQQANFNAREKMNQRAAILGMPQPVPAGLSKPSQDIVAAITRSEVEQSALDKAMAEAQAAKLVGGQQTVLRKQRTDDETVEEFNARFPQEGEATPAQMRVMLEQKKTKKEATDTLNLFKLKRAADLDNAFRDAASSVGFEIVDDDSGFASRDSKDKFHSLYALKNVFEPIIVDGEEIKDNLGQTRYLQTKRYVARSSAKTKDTPKPPTRKGEPIPGFGKGVTVSPIIPTGE